MDLSPIRLGEFRAGEEAMEIPPKIPQWTWCIMIALSVKVSVSILGAQCRGSGPPHLVFLTDSLKVLALLLVYI